MMTRRLSPAAAELLVIATHNKGKLAELVPLFAPFGLALVSAGALGLPEPVEDADDFAGNARIKALAASIASGLPALADDSGLCVAGLAGAPGIYSARWAGAGKDFAPAMQRVLTELGSNPDRRAWFICALCLAWPDGETATFQGRVDGTLAPQPRGTHLFGYDPLFIPLGDTRTYGEMPPAEKESSSHRSRAFAQFQSACLPMRA